MSFNDFLNKAWQDHAQQSSEVAKRLEDGISLIQESSQIPSLANLIIHVCGEHLGNWEQGLGLLKKLSNHQMITADSQTSIARASAALKLAQDPATLPQGFSASDMARVYAMAGAARSGQGDSAGSARLLDKAVGLAAELAEGDPAQRALAVTGNNLAVGLEEKPARTVEENELMVKAAALGLEKWKLAGGWNEVSLANYRMAKSLLQADRAEKAFEYAVECLRLCSENSAGPLDMFFAYEVVAQANWMRGRSKEAHEILALAIDGFNKLGENEKSWAGKDLEKLKRLVSS